VKVLFVGGGNMAQAIIGGLLSKGLTAGDLAAIEPFPATRAHLEAMNVQNTATLQPGQLTCDVIVLAVKPQVMGEALAPFAGLLTNQLVISIAAGVRCGDIARWLATDAAPYANIVRAMPNTPALIHAGITGLFATPAVQKEGREAAESLLAAVGKTAWFADEDMLDAVTAVSGSGPAYVFYFIEALEKAAGEMGFDAATARSFAIETFLGGARLAAHSADAPSELRRKVTSKRGTTERALDTFEHHQLGEKFIEGVKAACQRSRELGDELGRAGNTGGERQ
jgi:pyrroline-5-carboxylate reductase